MSSTDEQSFGRLLMAVEPWLEQIVVVGGWAHRLYRDHPTAQSLDYSPLMTLDTDIAIPLELPVQQPDLRTCLLSHGFSEELLGVNRPPATHYHLGEGADGFYAEFLTPLLGSEYDRRGRRKATIAVSGITAQRLRHIELLLEQPWLVYFQSKDFAGNVRVANPVSDMVQKLLIQPERDRLDRAKDILYLHDTLEVFGSRLGELRDLWRDELAPQLPARTRKAAVERARDLFGELTDDVRRAAQSAAGRTLTAAAVRETCGYGFRQLFE